MLGLGNHEDRTDRPRKEGDRDPLRGAVFGGLALGALEAFVAGYISTTLMDAVVTACLIVCLLFRPYGITGTRELVKL